MLLTMFKLMWNEISMEQSARFHSTMQIPSTIFICYKKNKCFHPFWTTLPSCRELWLCHSLWGCCCVTITMWSCRCIHKYDVFNSFQNEVHLYFASSIKLDNFQCATQISVMKYLQLYSLLFQYLFLKHIADFFSRIVNEVLPAFTLEMDLMYFVKIMGIGPQT